MTPQDKPAFAAMLAMLGEYYGREISDGLIGMYWQGLEEYDLDAVRDAINRHMRNPDAGQFMPRIADITRMLQGSTQDTALRAWAKVDRAIRHVGTYQSVAFDDPLIHVVVQDMGGWIGLGSRTEDEWPFVAREFETRYRGYRSRLASRDYPRVLIGISEAHNARTGKTSRRVVSPGSRVATGRESDPSRRAVGRGCRMTCLSCRYAIRLATGLLWCVRDRTKAAARCDLFAYEPGTDEGRA